MKFIITESQYRKLISEQDGYTDQVNWFESYLKSPMYLERLKKEFPNKKANELEQERTIRLNNFLSAKNNTHFVKNIGKKPGYISGMYIPKKIEDALIWDYKTKSWEPKKDDGGIFQKGHVYFEKEFSPKSFNPSSGFETIPTHEFGHAVDDGGNRIPQSTIDKIFKYTGGGSKSDPEYKTKSGQVFDYYTTPTEFINRLQPIRYLLKKNNIYDASKNVFTDKDYELMMKNSNIKNDTHFQDIFKSLKGTDQEKKKNFIDLMNTIAVNKNMSSDIS